MSECHDVPDTAERKRPQHNPEGCHIVAGGRSLRRPPVNRTRISLHPEGRARFHRTGAGYMNRDKLVSTAARIKRGTHFRVQDDLNSRRSGGVAGSAPGYFL
jgi:hypothetical protein